MIQSEALIPQKERVTGRVLGQRKWTHCAALRAYDDNGVHPIPACLRDDRFVAGAKWAGAKIVRFHRASVARWRAQHIRPNGLGGG